MSVSRNVANSTPSDHNDVVRRSVAGYGVSESVDTVGKGLSEISLETEGSGQLHRHEPVSAVGHELGSLQGTAALSRSR